ncbi:MAG: SDR family oxidoreductase [Bacteroidales bacterium]|nr:SDR family oxidoreductase [Bacteroidales bacterium]
MIIFITGITSGFGKAMAERLSADGHTVYGTHRSARDFIPGVTYIKADATSDEDVEAAVKQVVDAEGRIDVFINNAGMGIGGPLEFTSIAQAQRQMDVNFMGMVRFLHHVVPVMRKQGFGTIICFSSIAGKLGLPFQGFYSASKFAIEGYCDALRLEVRQFGIKVVVIEPGDFATGFTGSRKKVESEEAYEAYPSYKASIEGMENDERTGLKPEYLAGEISRIVMKKNPKCSYTIATFVQKMSIPLSVILPKKLWNRIFASWYGL